MKERPIHFSAPMVRALLAGTKTHTRRVCKLPPAPANLGTWEPFIFGGQGCRDSRGNEISGQMTIAHSRTGAIVGCPFGVPGDRLWVREAWAKTVCLGTEMTVYREGDNRTDYGGPWKPGIHMFRRDSRITLEVTGVRVERLHDISEADAIAEGCTNSLHLQGGRFARENFADLWWTINGDGSWEANPWVWAVDFRVLPLDSVSPLLPEGGA